MSYENKLNHLGIAPIEPPQLTYANEHRPRQLEERFFYQLLDRCRATLDPPYKFCFTRWSDWHQSIRQEGLLHVLADPVKTLMVLNKE